MEYLDKQAESWLTAAREASWLRVPYGRTLQNTPACGFRPTFSLPWTIAGRCVGTETRMLGVPVRVSAAHATGGSCMPGTRPLVHRSVVCQARYLTEGILFNSLFRVCPQYQAASLRRSRTKAEYMGSRDIPVLVLHRLPDSSPRV